MSDSRKGIFLPEQEQTLDKLLKFKNRAAEAVDGPLISIVDNQIIERLKQSAEAKYPGVSEEFIYPMVDVIMAGLESLAVEE